MTDALRFTAPAPAPVGNRRKAAKLATREKVLRAAREVFTRRTYATATMRAIAAGAGVSTGSIFVTFADKADLWRAAMNCEPPLDTPIVRAAPDLYRALNRLMAFRPVAVIPPHMAASMAVAWAEAEQALALASAEVQPEARAA